MLKKEWEITLKRGLKIDWKNWLEMFAVEFQIKLASQLRMSSTCPNSWRDCICFISAMWLLKLSYHFANFTSFVLLFGFWQTYQKATSLLCLYYGKSFIFFGKLFTLMQITKAEKIRSWSAKLNENKGNFDRSLLKRTQKFD